MNCECNNNSNSNRVKPRIKHVYGNVLRMAIPLTLRTLVKDGDEMIVNDTDFIPSSDHLVRVVFSKGKTNYPITATMDGNVAIIEDKGKIPVGTYDISVECYDNLGNPYRFKQNAVLYVADTTAEAGIDEEIEYEAQTWYLNAAVFLATTEIGEIGDVIDAKLDDVFGNAVYDANAKEIRFYNKGNSRVLATIDSRPFIADGTVEDVYIDVSRQVLVVVLNDDAGGTRFSVPLYLVFNSYYKKDEVDSLVSRKVEGVRMDFSQELPLVVPVTKNGSSISSSLDFGAIDNAIGEDGRLVVACVNNGKFYQLLNANGTEVTFSRVVALDGYQELLIVDESNVWSMEEVDLGTGGGGGYEPPVGGIPKSDLAQSVQDTLDDVSNKVDKETGKGLSTNDYTTAEKTKLAGIAAGAEVNVQPNWTQTNTSADDYIKNKPTFDSTPTASSTNPVTSGGVKTYVDSKASITGITTSQDGTFTISLSDGNSYTVNLNHVHPQYVESDDLADVALSGSYNDLTDKPTIPDTSSFVTTSTLATALQGKADTSDIPTKVSDLTNDSGFTSNAGTITGITMNGASKGTSGVVDLGTVITANQDISGKANKSEMSVSKGTGTNAGKTTITLTSETGKSATVLDSTHPAASITDANKTAWNNKQSAINDLDTIRSGAAKGATAIQQADLAAVATSGSYNDLENKPTIPSKTSDLTNDSDFATSDDVENAIAGLVDSAPGTLDTLNELAQALGDDPNFATTIATALGNKVDKESGKSLMTDAERTKLSGIAAGAEVNVNADWNATSGDAKILNKPTLAAVATSGSYNDLSNKPTIPAAQVNADWNATSGVSRILNKPTIPTVPTNVSSFTNDAGYLTQQQSLANYYTKTEIDTKIGNIETLLASI